MKSINMKCPQTFLLALMFLLTLTQMPVHAAAIHEDDHGKPDLAINLSEWGIILNHTKVSAGKAYLKIINNGKEVHELLIIKLNEGVKLEAGKFPVDKHGKVNEDKMTYGVLTGEIEGLMPGDRVSKLLDLTRGHYAIICNILEQEPDGTLEAHYSLGMNTLLTVE